MENKCKNCAHLDVLASTCKKKKGYDKIVKMDDSCGYFEEVKEKCDGCENCTCDTIVIGLKCHEDADCANFKDMLKIHHTDGTVSRVRYFDGTWKRITMTWTI